ncbi:MAG: glycosyltransferase family 2 protein [Nanoarchaeota archaeon]
MNSKGRLIFLLPALNEEKGIANTIRKIPANVLKKEGYLCEIVIVDGGSSDRTVEIAKKCGARVILSPKKGYGFQYKYGLSRIKGDYVITGDSDGTYPFETAPKLVEMLREENLDFITTNRFSNLKENSMSVSHYFGNKILTYMGNILFGMRIKDNQSGMWCPRLLLMGESRLFQAILLSLKPIYSERHKYKEFN